jgi:DNA-binding NtrC family response regulator
MLQRRPTRVEQVKLGGGRALKRRSKGGRSLPVGSLVVHRFGRHTTIALYEDKRYVFGRSDDADVVFEDDRVSRRHGLLEHTIQGWRYHDLGASNASYFARADDVPIALDDDVPCTRFSGKSVEMGVGDAVLLGSRNAWIELIDEVPEDALHAGAPSDTHVSTAAQEFERSIEIAARTTLPVFLLGASGVGKTFAAREIHKRSRLPGPFVVVNCARLPTDPSQLHSEMLGHVDGAYTGTNGARVGRLFYADGGTLFLDEVESLPEVAQGFLLDVLEGSGELAPLGAAPGKGPAKLPRIRLISASKRALKKSGLRNDLCERLADGHLWRVPSLRHRREDIPGLIRAFLLELREENGVNAEFEDDAINFAQEQRWPGEVRELRATVRTIVMTAQAARGEQPESESPVVVEESDLRRRLRHRAEAFDGVPDTQPDGEPPEAVRSVNPRHLTETDVRRALAAENGNKTAAARRLGVARNTLLAKMKRFGIA